MYQDVFSDYLDIAIKISRVTDLTVDDVLFLLLADKHDNNIRLLRYYIDIINDIIADNISIIDIIKILSIY